MCAGVELGGGGCLGVCAGVPVSGKVWPPGSQEIPQIPMVSILYNHLQKGAVQFVHCEQLSTALPAVAGLLAVCTVYAFCKV